MPETLPVPLTCEVPPGWQSAPPEEVGAPHAAFVALHLASRGSGFIPNITISGRPREAAVDLHELADESLQRLRDTVGPVELVKRTDVGPGFAQGLAGAAAVVQNVRVYAQQNGHPVQLCQSQVLLLVEDVHRPDRYAEFEIALTARADQLDEVLDDFQDFLHTVRPVDPAAESGNEAGGAPAPGEEEA
ncbi:hypothetical protein ABZY90_19385 [Streptomyces sp. NPDC006422]|uniref:hypothetical protein n=1 Tax=unclassified Streptomyces TaxID=2593676 RepID=UPI0033BB8874